MMPNPASTASTARAAGSNGAADSAPEKERPVSSGYDLALSHYSSLKQYLNEHFQKISGVSPQRQSAREKLTKLTKQQFQELSTDVFDETNRRIMSSNEVPFLPVCDDFHPKRNQARQKLATLPESRFKDLASDVFAELERRYPILQNINIPMKSLEKSYENVNADAAARAGSAAANAGAASDAAPPHQGQHQTNGHQAALSTSPAQSTGVLGVSNGGADSLSAANSNGNFSSANGAISGQSKPVSTGIATKTAPAVAPAPAPAQQETPSSSTSFKAKPQNGLNFANLDSLMADLGNLMNPASVSSEQRLSSSISNVDKHAEYDAELQRQKKEHDGEIQRQRKEHEAETLRQKREFEATVEKLNKEIDHLKLELKEHLSKPDVSAIIKELNEQLSQTKGTIEKLQLEKETSEKVNKQHQATVAQLQSAIQEQKHAVESLQAQHVNEMRVVREELELAEKQRDLERKRIKTIMEEKSKLELDLNEAQMENISLKNEIKALEASLKEKMAAAAAKAPASSAGPNGAVPDGGKPEGSGAPLQGEQYPISLNGYEGQPEDSDGIDPSRISAYKLAAEKLLDSIQRDTAQMLIAIRGLVVATRNILEDSEAVEIRHGKSMAPSDRERLAEVQNKVNLQLQELMAAAKRNATSQGVENAESAQAMRTAVGHLSTLATEDILRVLKASRQGGSHAGSSHHQHHHQPQILQQQGNAALPGQSVPLSGPPSALKATKPTGLLALQASGNGSASASSLQQPSLDGDNLKIFLEKQTDQIVQGIQNLLMAMKESIFGEKFIGYVNSITQVVEQLIQTSRQALSKPALASKRAAGEKVLKELMGCNVKLKDLEIAMRSSLTYRPQRHVVAASVRDVANFTKELVKLLE